MIFGAVLGYVGSYFMCEMLCDMCAVLWYVS